MKTILILMAMILTIGVGSSSAADSLPIGQPNMLSMEGVAPTFDLQVNYGEDFAKYAMVSPGVYDMVVYFDQAGVETMIDSVNAALQIGDIERFNYDEVKVWLGNLTDPGQKKSMPQGEVDLANKRVIFRHVIMKPGDLIRWNLPCKFYKQGQEVILDNSKGPLGKGFAWGWLPDNGAAVTGTEHNGQRIQVQPDGTLLPKPYKKDSKPLP